MSNDQVPLCALTIHDRKGGCVKSNFYVHDGIEAIILKTLDQLILMNVHPIVETQKRLLESALAEPKNDEISTTVHKLIYSLTKNDSTIRNTIVVYRVCFNFLVESPTLTSLEGDRILVTWSHSTKLRIEVSDEKIELSYNDDEKASLTGVFHDIQHSADQLQLRRFLFMITTFLNTDQ
jgi:hypothetical protein